MMSAALVTTPPVLLSPSTMASEFARTVAPRFAHSRDDEDLVVHRETEEHGEEEDRDPPLDLADVVGTEESRTDTEAEDQDEQSVGDAHRDEVERGGDQGEHQ